MNFVYNWEAGIGNLDLVMYDAPALFEKERGLGGEFFN
jgi:hypothetical protein